MRRRVMYAGRYVAEVVEDLGGGRLVIRFYAQGETRPTERIVYSGEWSEM